MISLVGSIRHPASFSALTYSGSRIPFSTNREPDKSSWGVVSRQIRPSSTRMIRSTGRCSTSSSRCSMITTVLPVRLCSSSISSIASLPVAGSKFASGSSNSSTCTSSTITPASETRCFCPPDSAPGGCSRKSSISTSAAIRSTSSIIRGLGTHWFSSENAISSATVSPTNCPSVSCSTVPTSLFKS